MRNPARELKKTNPKIPNDNQPKRLEEIPIEERHLYVLYQRNDGYPTYAKRTKYLEPEEANGDPAKLRMYRLLRWFNCPRVTTLDDLSARIISFFEECARVGDQPTIEKLALALGVTAPQLLQWRGGEGVSADWAALCRQAVSLTAGVEADRAIDGDMPQSTYQFRAKNFFEMRDKVEVSMENHNPQVDYESEEEIAKRLLESITTVELEKGKDGKYEVKK